MELILFVIYFHFRFYFRQHYHSSLSYMGVSALSRIPWRRDQTVARSLQKQ
jgi:hypothetical protein